LHAVRMSTPTTCHPVITTVFQRKDILFHVLYGANLDYIGRMIEESAVNISREYPSPQSASKTDEGVAGALQLLRPKEGDSLHYLQIKFLVLLNEDETMRKNISNVARTSLVASLCPYKAERFYDALSDELIPTWTRSRLKNGDFLDLVRSSYLVS
jgi:hypothetical protein